MGTGVTESTMIGTKSRASLMDVPAEIRVKIFEYLLIFPDEIMVPARKPSCDCTPAKGIYFPRVSILRTCKLINVEATPIFYSINRFVVSLPLERPFLHKALTSLPRKPNFQLSYFRWSTLAQIKSLSFISGNNTGFAEDAGERVEPGILALAPMNTSPSTNNLGAGVVTEITELDPINGPPSTNDREAGDEPIMAPIVVPIIAPSTNELAIRLDGSYLRPRPCFECTGLEILARFSISDRQYSPGGPDDYMALSLSNWVSMKVMRAELNAFQKELEVMMRTVPPPVHVLPPALPLPDSIDPIHTDLMREMDFLAGVDVDVLESPVAGPSNPTTGSAVDTGEGEESQETRNNDVD